MKRFFMYCIVIIGTLFVGLAFYMFAKNNETISSTVPQGETIYLNVGDDVDIPINHKKKNKRTTIETKSDNSNVASINFETGKIEAKAGGTATIVITPSNANFGPFTFVVRVGDGSTDNPYFISSPAQLLRIGAMDTVWTLNDCYEVVSNIDLKETWVDGNPKCWEPIGNKDNHFTGNFNGGTKTISNLIIDETCTSDNVGLFGYVESGSRIEKVTLVNPQIKVSGKNVGAIAGYSEGSITRCKIVKGDISSTSTEGYVGGIVGVATRTATENEIAMCQIENASLNSGNVVGGIAGKFVAGVVANCKVGATIANNQDIKPNYAGGLIGEIEAKDVAQKDGSPLIYNSLIQTNLVIANFGKDDETYYAHNKDVLIANDSLKGDSATKYVGNIFYSDSLESDRATKLSTQELEDQTKYQYVDELSKTISWDFSGTWSFDGKTEADLMGPYIIQDGVGQTVRPLRNGTEVNNSNAADVIGQLVRAGKSDELSGILNYTFVITEDITIDVKEEFPQGWTPIGNVQRPYNGAIYCKDNASLTLKNVVIPNSNIVAYVANGEEKAEKTAGIFGCVSNSALISGIKVEGLIINSDQATTVGGIAGKNYGIIKDVTIDGLNIKNGRYVGGLVGYNSGEVTLSRVETGDVKLSEIPEGQTEEVELDKKINANSEETVYIGGVVGFNTKKVYCCKADVIVEGASSKSTYVGGVVGSNESSAYVILSAKVGGGTQAGGSDIRLGGVVGLNSGSIDRCYSELSAVSAAKTSESYTGGIVGQTNQGEITSSYFDGTLEGYYVGGIVGSNYGSTIEKCYSNAGIIASKKIGGLGYRVHGTIKNCYFNATSQIQFAEGSKKENVFAGLAVDFPRGGHIENCYISTTQGIASNGNHIIDVENEGRSSFASFVMELIYNDTYGTIINNVINKNGISIGWWEENMRKLVFSSKAWRDDNFKFKSTNISGEGLLDGSITSYFTSECKFDSTIWDFSGKTPKLFGLNLSGAIEEEFADPIINYSLAEGTEANVSLEGTELKFTSFVDVAKISLAVSAENTLETPTASLLEGDCIELGTISEGKLEITIKAVGAAKIQLALTDGTTVDITVTVE